MAPHTRGTDAPFYTDETHDVPQSNVSQLTSRARAPRLTPCLSGHRRRSDQAAATASGTIVSHP